MITDDSRKFFKDKNRRAQRKLTISQRSCEKNKLKINQTRVSAPLSRTLKKLAVAAEAKKNNCSEVKEKLEMTQPAEQLEHINDENSIQSNQFLNTLDSKANRQRSRTLTRRRPSENSSDEASLQRPGNRLLSRSSNFSKGRSVDVKNKSQQMSSEDRGVLKQMSSEDRGVLKEIVNDSLKILDPTDVKDGEQKTVNLNQSTTTTTTDLKAGLKSRLARKKKIEIPSDDSSSSVVPAKKSHPEAASDSYKPLYIAPGLLNLGNTCYMNSAMQVFYFTPGFRTQVYNLTKVLVQVENDINALFVVIYFDKETLMPKRIRIKWKLIMDLNDLLTEMHHAKKNGNRFVHPDQFFHTFLQLNPSFKIQQQEDVHEFFQSLLSLIQESISELNLIRNKLKRLVEESILARPGFLSVSIDRSGSKSCHLPVPYCDGAVGENDRIGIKIEINNRSILPSNAADFRIKQLNLKRNGNDESTPKCGINDRHLSRNVQQTTQTGSSFRKTCTEHLTNDGYKTISDITFEPVADFVTDIFYGNLQRVTRCMECENESRVDEKFLCLQLSLELKKNSTARTNPVVSEFTVNRCDNNNNADDDGGVGDGGRRKLTTGDDYQENGESNPVSEDSDVEEGAALKMRRVLQEKEKLDADNKFLCDMCDHRCEGERRTCFTDAPRILTIHVQRFNPSQSRMGSFTKVTENCDIPLEMDCIEEGCTDSSHRYHLFGIISHSGSIVSAGHYSAYIKPPPSPSLTDGTSLFPEGQPVDDPGPDINFSPRNFKDHQSNEPSTPITPTGTIVIHPKQTPSSPYLNSCPSWLVCNDSDVSYLNPGQLARLTSSQKSTNNPVLLFYTRFAD